MSTPKHPGMIVYEDKNEDTSESMDISQVPEDMRFADTEDGLVPIVKVVAYTSGNQRFITEYGPEDRLLRETIQFDETALPGDDESE